jgi:hypothetical protein|tara:strand:+ start:2613 stop:3173 length:561 start_codon:yes stop_codon:yes gene_type:complete
MSDKASVFETLSAIDCSDHTEKKGQFTYLSWTFCWQTIKQHYSDAEYQIEDDVVYPDSTMEVRCTVTIHGLAHTMWLPVLDFKNKAQPNPDAFSINSSRMRCLVKCCAMHGLGLYIYSGLVAPEVPVELIGAKGIEHIEELIHSSGASLEKFLKAYSVKVLSDLTEDQYIHAVDTLERKIANTAKV